MVGSHYVILMESEEETVHINHTGPESGRIWEGAGNMAYRPRCFWRHRLAGRARNLVLRRFLSAVLICECLVGAGRLFSDRIPEAFAVRRGETVDWFVPKEDAGEGIYEVFGIQFRFEDGEVRIYHSREEIKRH